MSLSRHGTIKFNNLSQFQNLPVATIVKQPEKTRSILSVIIDAYDLFNQTDQSDAKLALTQLENKLDQIHPDFILQLPEIYLLQAMLCGKLGEHEKAVQIYRNIREQRPDCWQAFLFPVQLLIELEHQNSDTSKECLTIIRQLEAMFANPDTSLFSDQGLNKAYRVFQTIPVEYIPGTMAQEQALYEQELADKRRLEDEQRLIEQQRIQQEREEQLKQEEKRRQAWLREELREQKMQAQMAKKYQTITSQNEVMSLKDNGYAVVLPRSRHAGMYNFFSKLNPEVKPDHSQQRVCKPGK